MYMYYTGHFFGCLKIQEIQWPSSQRIEKKNEEKLES